MLSYWTTLQLHSFKKVVYKKTSYTFVPPLYTNSWNSLKLSELAIIIIIIISNFLILSYQHITFTWFYWQFIHKTYKHLISAA